MTGSEDSAMLPPALLNLPQAALPRLLLPPCHSRGVFFWRMLALARQRLEDRITR